MTPALVPEFAVSDCKASVRFYRDLIGFQVVYDRPEEGFAYLQLGQAALMLDQIGLGRTFGDGHLPNAYPFGRGVNLQIRVPSVDAIAVRLIAADIALFLPIEEKWYRRDDGMIGQRQFVVADPDGYLLRLFEPLAERDNPLL